MSEDIEYCIKTYTPAQIVASAEACGRQGCPSWVYCLMGKPRKQADKVGYALPVCGRRVLQAREGA